MAEIEITVDKGVVEITKAPKDIEIIVTDLDSKEQDRYYGRAFHERTIIE